MISEPVAFTRKLISLDTVNPPGNEAVAAELTGQLLSKHGFVVNYIHYGNNRLHLIAEKGCREDKPAIVFTGHFDTVPIGAQKWSFDPFGGEIVDGRLYGRGSSDMKSGISAMCFAAIQAFRAGTPPAGVRFVLTAGEETGCQGAVHIVDNYDKMGKACGIVVGEPTANVPAIGHKGGLYLKVSAWGKTAHSSMPHLGDNAIYKAARAVLKAAEFNFDSPEDQLLGFSTLNVGRMHGGINLNSVPDYAEFTIDARTTTQVDHQWLLERLRQEVGDEVEFEILVDLPAVASEEKSDFVKTVYDACGVRAGSGGYPRSLPYLTDGAVLQPAYGGVPTVILGPGQPEQAHQTDEYCYTENIEKAVDIYKQIIINGGIYSE